MGKTPDLSSNGSRADANAILFEIPESKPLSMLQFRHANLNSYLHGPSYALGNSYASTQVARHRSWGRVQTIEHEPTSIRGMTPAMMLDMEEKRIIFYEECKKEFPDEMNPGFFNAHNWGLGGGAAWNWVFMILTLGEVFLLGEWMNLALN